MEISEIWLPVKGFVGKYEVSNLGRVKSIGGKFKLSPESYIGSVDKLGYPATTLRLNGKRLCIRIHTLVADAFIAKPQGLGALVVNHLDGNKANNRIDNLEWITPADNVKHAVATGLLSRKGEKHENARLTEADVMQIRELYKTQSQRYIAEQFSVGRRHLSDIINGVCWPHLPVFDYSRCRTFRHMYPKANPKFNKEQIAEMLSLHGKRPYNEIAEKCGCSTAFLSKLFNGKVKSAPNYASGAI